MSPRFGGNLASELVMLSAAEIAERIPRLLATLRSGAKVVAKNAFSFPDGRLMETASEGALERYIKAAKLTKADLLNRVGKSYDGFFIPNAFIDYMRTQVNTAMFDKYGQRQGWKMFGNKAHEETLDDIIQGQILDKLNEVLGQ